jgi:hypothetical protein
VISQRLKDVAALEGPEAAAVLAMPPDEEGDDAAALENVD